MDHQSPSSRPNRAGFLFILIATIFAYAVWLSVSTVNAAAGSPRQPSESLPVGATPTAPSANADSPARTSPLIGIVVLLVPFIFIAWKSRGVKEPKVRASCCAPVVDENQRPFQIYGDPPDPKKIQEE